MGRRVIIHNHLPQRTRDIDPYQFTEGKTAAEAGKPEKAPYPEGSEAIRYWKAGYQAGKGKTGDVNRFGRSMSGGSGAYKCEGCGKTTRETGLGESGVQLCKACYAEAQIENVGSDHGVDSPQYRQVLAEFGKYVKK